ncbi:hypothetical protein FQA39_LY10822 [Lamprigera yunnana]|nr:hypothetical protein FQA39_LY10822 [Lamprigera yunnana]
MDRWIGKVAVVTGASSGIGAATVRKLVKAGIIVAGIARRIERINELTQELQDLPGKLHPFKTDITKEDEVVKTFDIIKSTLGPIHILVNSAGIVRDTSIIDGEANLWKEVLETNLFGSCIAIRETVRDMKKNNVMGHIVLLNSILGHKISYSQDFNVYSSSKFGITALAEVVKKELLALGSEIKVTSISPGAVDTEFSDSCSSLKAIFSMMPLLKAEEVADTIMYVLATPSHVQITELLVQHIRETF